MIAGVDEVGRGPLAGPVIAAAVILNHPIDGVMDSKGLTPKRRQALSILIKKHAIAFSYGRAEAEEIDNLNIHHATLLAMRRAVEGLNITPSEILVDGLFCPKVLMTSRAIVKGDTLIHQISAASILAKVLRDEEMILMDNIYPGYGFADHKGYPTAHHREALKVLGPCAIHRKSFGPVAAAYQTCKK